LSNTALTISFLPIISFLAIDLDFPVNMFCMAIVMAASCAFMLPIATPPNAVIFSTEKIKITSMIKIGLVINLSSIVVLALIFNYLL
jgi:sodium-dependent dicarboxylate transporter 2/3/5